MKKILKYKNIFLGFSLAMMLAGLTAVLLFGFKLSIDFTSGSLWQLEIPGTSVEELKTFFSDQFNIGQVSIAVDKNSDTYTLILQEVSDNERRDILTTLKTRFGEGVADLDFWSVSPTVSSELRSKAFWAIGLVLLGISLYIAFAFRKVSQPIRSWKYGAITLLTLSHDVLIPAGLFALLGKTAGVAIDINFIVALLVVMGFSVHDTIVVFDRIRENLTKFGDRLGLEELIDKSVIETVARSINTTLTLILVLLSLYIWGPVSLHYFILVILVGTVFGAYSSILVASPLLLWVRGKMGKA